LDAAGELVVAMVYSEIADRFLVQLPNGKLAAYRQADATITDRPYEPVSKKALLAELAKEQFQGYKTRETNRYVYVYNTSEEFYKATSTILETMYPALYKYCEREKLDVHDPDVPLVVVMFKTEAEFQAYHRMPDGVVAYYNGVSNHVMMYEQSRLAEIAPELAIKQSISTIAHEGVHQILHNIGVQQRLSRWPMWISEGLPEFFAPTKVDKRVRWKGVGLVNDLRMHSLLEYIKQRPTSEPGQLVRETVDAEQLDATGYAEAWALTHYLAKYKRKEFFAYLRDVSQFQSLARREQPDVDLFVKHFGQDYAELESAMLKSLKKLPYSDPIANQTHYLVILAGAGGRRISVGVSPAHVQQLIAQAPGAAVTVQAFPDRASAERAFHAAAGR
ncbi:MAG: DUF1570 domain-containing protein, partial [Pirellulales bacterium]